MTSELWEKTFWPRKTEKLRTSNSGPNMFSKFNLALRHCLMTPSRYPESMTKPRNFPGRNFDPYVLIAEKSGLRFKDSLKWTKTRAHGIL